VTAILLNRVDKGSVLRSRDIGRVIHELESLDEEKSWRVTIEEQKSRRTLSQNALLWAIYTEIIQRGGEAMQGWTKDDLHEFFLINHFGSDVRTLFGKKRHIPLRRSSRLSKSEFSDFVESIHQFMAERGIVL
jgi:hypothetical protein